MPRYWVRHAAESAGFVAAGLAFGAGLRALGNQGNFQYLQEIARYSGYALQIGGSLGGVAYFLIGIPRVIRQERAQRTRDNYRDADEIDSQTDIIDAANDQARVLGGHRPRRRH